MQTAVTNSTVIICSWKFLNESLIASLQHGPQSLHLPVFMHLNSLFPHWIRAGLCAQQNMMAVRLGHKMHCYFYFGFLNWFLRGKADAILWGYLSKPVERPTGKEVRARANHQYQLISHVSEPHCKRILQPDWLTLALTDNLTATSAKAMSQYHAAKLVHNYSPPDSMRDNKWLLF